MTAHDVDQILSAARTAREIAFTTESEADVASYIRIRHTAWMTTGVDVATEPRP